MLKLKLVLPAVLALATAGTAVGVGGIGTGPARWRTAALRAYWSVLDAEQKEQAKGILAETLAETAPDRLAAQARVLRYRADVAAVLTVEQRKRAGEILAHVARLPKAERWALADRLLDGTDRAALKGRIEMAASATPEEKVDLGLQILDQVRDVLVTKLGEKIELTAEQRARIDALAAELKQDVRPIAVRLASARETAERKALALLRPEQKEKLESLRQSALARILAFVRG